MLRARGTLPTSKFKHSPSRRIALALVLAAAAMTLSPAVQAAQTTRGKVFARPSMSKMTPANPGFGLTVMRGRQDRENRLAKRVDGRLGPRGTYPLAGRGWGYGGGFVIERAVLPPIPEAIDPYRGSAVQPGAMGNVTRTPGTPVVYRIARTGGGLSECAAEPRRFGQRNAGQDRRAARVRREADAFAAPGTFVSVTLC